MPPEKKPNKHLFDLLLIDDDATVVDFCRDGLEGPSFRVTAAYDGKSARCALQEKPFHVVVTDLQLPDTNGIEITKLVRAEYPGTEVIVLTGHPGSEPTVTALKSGAYAYLMKPLNLYALSSTIRHCVERRILLGRLAQVNACADAMERALHDLRERVGRLPPSRNLAAMALERETYRDIGEALSKEIHRLQAIIRQEINLG